MRTRFDVAIYDRDARLTLIVEVKVRRLGATATWAVALRKDLRESGFLPDVPYFLLALPERFFLWAGNELPDDAPPTYEIDPAPILDWYLGDAGIDAHELDVESLGMVVNAWLNRVTLTREFGDVRPESVHWLKESGLYDAIQRGHIAFHEAA